MRIGGGTRGPLRVAAYPLCDIVEERLSLSVLPGGARWGVQLVRTRRAAVAYGGSSASSACCGKMHHQPQHSPLATALLDQTLTYLVLLETSGSVVLCVRVVLCLAFCFEFNVDPWSRSASTTDASKTSICNQRIVSTMENTISTVLHFET